MNERQNNLLRTIIEHYIKTVQPVSSKFITDSGNFDLSSATIRNEMAELENQGFIFHPHTSAGRIPTEKGYQYYVDNFILDSKISRKNQDMMAKSIKSRKGLANSDIKDLAKSIADISDGAVFVAFANNDFYYTGLSNLFAQPEFIDHRLVYHLSQVVDHFDQVIGKIFLQISGDVEISVGRKNPFSPDCSAIFAKYQTKKDTGLLGILGPTRMDYQNNFDLIHYGQKLIHNIK